ncbi:hypothetical protein KIL84_007396 [Mauremys mutica]|uniref:Uncharacterized protein n=1 Tax=Mauremys mutica TaxID=74926 RepID=A0A9D4AV08_9SAUR|nr:hypothetical protein KIL84_007396 [Mauremys mutica]
MPMSRGCKDLSRTGLYQACMGRGTSIQRCWGPLKTPREKAWEASFLLHKQPPLPALTGSRPHPSGCTGRMLRCTFGSLSYQPKQVEDGHLVAAQSKALRSKRLLRRWRGGAECSNTGHLPTIKHDPTHAREIRILEQRAVTLLLPLLTALAPRRDPSWLFFP